MGLFKTIVVGAAIYGVYKFLTEQDDFGRTRLDALKEDVPDFLDKAKVVKNDIVAGGMPEDL